MPDGPLFVVFYNLSSVGPLWQLLLIALLGLGPWW